MIKVIFFLIMVLFQTVQARVVINQGLKEEDQKYYKNESFAGMNKLERIDQNVKEINKLHGEIEALKNEMAKMKQDIEELKKK